MPRTRNSVILALHCVGKAPGEEGYRVALSGFFTVAEAARITKVPRSTIDYWARTKLIVPSQRKARPRLFSFADLRDLAVAGELRRQGARVKDLRVALMYVRSLGDDSIRLAQANFGVYDGQLVTLDEEGVPVAPHLQGQRIFEIHMEKIFALLGMGVRDTEEMRPVERILIHPRIRGGTPVIEGTRIPAALIARLAKEGVAYRDVLDL
jgi:DNA-binding transcriptional MerR regulator